MRCSRALAAALAAGSAAAQETVLGVYIFSRHADRTAKAWPPTSLTDLGYEEAFTSGTYFRNRYVASGASYPIYGINTDLVKESQITASAPVDTVIQNSAQGFLQGLYPPVGQTLGSETLRNGTVVQSPLNGYQLIPLQAVSAGTNGENDAWLEGASGCANAEISGDEFFSSELYLNLLSKTQDFYNSLSPMINRTFTASQASFKNAYLIFDLLNVASIHNSTDDFPAANLLTPEVFFQLRTLADTHEFNLAYNASEPIRAVTGSVIAAQVVSALNGTIMSKGASKLNIQFGAYAGMLSYFGLADLISVDETFYGVPDYASTLTWELVTNATVSSTSWPSEDEISVRFLFHNGTTSNISQPIEFPLFGTNQSPLPWSEFVTYMNMFAISNQEDWCNACGNTTGVCSPGALGLASNSSTVTESPSGTGHRRISLAVAGVIGAMVTLGVILGVELLIMILGGLRIVSKKGLAGTGAAAPSEVKA